MIGCIEQNRTVDIMFVVRLLLRKTMGKGRKDSTSFKDAEIKHIRLFNNMFRDSSRPPLRSNARYFSKAYLFMFGHPIPPAPLMCQVISHMLHIEVPSETSDKPAAEIVHTLYHLVRDSTVACRVLYLKPFEVPELSLSTVQQAFRIKGLLNLSPEQRKLMGVFKLASGLYDRRTVLNRLRIAKQAFGEEDHRVLAEQKSLCFAVGQVELGIALLDDSYEDFVNRVNKDVSQFADDAEPARSPRTPVGETGCSRDIRKDAIMESSDDEADGCYVVNDSSLRSSWYDISDASLQTPENQDAPKIKYKTGSDFYACRSHTWDICPLTGERFQEPVVAADGITYEAAAWTAWISENDDSPVVDEVLKHKRAVPNYAIKSAISLCESNPII